MTAYLAAYAAMALVIVALDFVWLGFVAKPLYQQSIGHLLAAQPNIPVAVVFYLLFALGLLIFAVMPNAANPSWGKTIASGALFGFFAYITYDLSNLATLRDWPVKIALIDIAWGTFISGVSAAAGKAAYQQLS